MNIKSIGKKGAEAKAIFQEYGLTPFRELLKPDDFEGISQETLPATRRKRALIPKAVFWLMATVSMQACCMGGALKTV